MWSCHSVGPWGSCVSTLVALAMAPPVFALPGVPLYHGATDRGFAARSVTAVGAGVLRAVVVYVIEHTRIQTRALAAPSNEDLAETLSAQFQRLSAIPNC